MQPGNRGDHMERGTEALVDSELFSLTSMC